MEHFQNKDEIFLWSLKSCVWSPLPPMVTGIFKNSRCHITNLQRVDSVSPEFLLETIPKIYWKGFWNIRAYFNIAWFKTTGEVPINHLPLDTSRKTYFFSFKETIQIVVWLSDWRYWPILPKLWVLYDEKTRCYIFKVWKLARIRSPFREKSLNKRYHSSYFIRLL